MTKHKVKFVLTKIAYDNNCLKIWHAALVMQCTYDLCKYIVDEANRGHLVYIDQITGNSKFQMQCNSR